MSPRMTMPLTKQHSGTEVTKPTHARMSSNDRNSGAMKVSIDIKTSTVKNSLGMKKTMKNMGKMRGLTSRQGNRSFNIGNMERSKDGSPLRSDGKS